ncbi:hypothetical protein MB901379_02172 [Mycobacterium basiliense]|uniref:Uncharacterized protein n=1 Tax=Mycobacterium basiliense TaxID=2094119 RepID=A0A3S4CBD2_9MYCO|nr:hypothetical protein MB901379_02172 [Mycobacterium basiliense]
MTVFSSERGEYVNAEPGLHASPELVAKSPL